MVYFENPMTQLVVTAVGPDNLGLADPLVHFATDAGANICEIQMFNRDSQSLFAMMMRCDWPMPKMGLEEARTKLKALGEKNGLDVRCWPLLPSQDAKPRIALCCTRQQSTPRAVLEGCKSGKLNAEVAFVLSNRDHCKDLAAEYDVPYEQIGDAKGKPDNKRFLKLLDDHKIDYVILARYMQILPERVCWSYAGGRIVNLHHGLLPPYPGATPYSDAYAHNMLTYGATAHFIIPELDAGNQIIHQTSFTVEPGTSKKEIIQLGQSQNEPECLTAALTKLFSGKVALHFHKVARVSNADQS